MFAFFNLGVTSGLHLAPLSYSSTILLNTYPWTAFMALMCENLQNSMWWMWNQRHARVMRVQWDCSLEWWRTWHGQPPSHTQNLHLCGFPCWSISKALLSPFSALTIPLHSLSLKHRSLKTTASTLNPREQRNRSSDGPHKYFRGGWVTMCKP